MYTVSSKIKVQTMGEYCDARETIESFISLMRFYGLSQQEIEELVHDEMQLVDELEA